MRLRGWRQGAGGPVAEDAVAGDVGVWGPQGAEGRARARMVEGAEVVRVAHAALVSLGGGPVGREGSEGKVTGDSWNG